MTFPRNRFDSTSRFIYDERARFDENSYKANWLDIRTHTTDTVIGDVPSDTTEYIRLDGTSASVQSTLPTLADNQGRVFYAKCVNMSNVCKLVGEGSENIEGANELVFTVVGEAVSIVGGPTEWEIF